MVTLPLMPKGDGTPVAGYDADRARLPLFYMNDFSRLGLRVHPCDAALRLLAEHHYGLVRSQYGHSVSLEQAAQLPELVELLARRGIACEIADVAETIYQG